MPNGLGIMVNGLAVMLNGHTCPTVSGRGEHKYVVITIYRHLGIADGMCIGGTGVPSPMTRCHNNFFK